MSKKTLLFIPFSEQENNFSLYLRALNWRSNLPDPKSDATEIVIYHQDNKNTNNSYEDHQVHYSFSSKLCSNNAVLYVLADGIDTPNIVGNLNSRDIELGEEESLLTIERVVHRLIESGLTPKLAQNLSSIKLFMCDYHHVSRERAVNFARALGEDYKDLTLFYYSAGISHPRFSNKTPNQVKAQKVAKKLVVDKNGLSKLVDAGTPSEHRHQLNVGKVLDMYAQQILKLSSLKSESEPLIEEIDDITTTDNEIMPSNIEFPSEEEISEHSDRELTKHTSLEIIRTTNCNNPPTDYISLQWRLRFFIEEKKSTSSAIDSASIMNFPPLTELK